MKRILSLHCRPTKLDEDDEDVSEREEKVAKQQQTLFEHFSRSLHTANLFYLFHL